MDETVRVRHGYKKRNCMRRDHSKEQQECKGNVTHSFLPRDTLNGFSQTRTQTKLDVLDKNLLQRLACLSLFHCR